MDQPLPIRFAAAMARLGPWEAAPLLAAGVSGGADSTALAILGNDWARAQGGRVLALIVDHGLRAESAGEARLTRDRLAGMPAITKGAGPRLLRHLLAEPPAVLRAFLMDRGVAWVEDPSNASPAALGCGCGRETRRAMVPGRSPWSPPPPTRGTAERPRTAGSRISLPNVSPSGRRGLPS